MNGLNHSSVMMVVMKMLTFDHSTIITVNSDHLLASAALSLGTCLETPRLCGCL